MEAAEKQPAERTASTQSISYILGANVENMNLNGNAAINGTGNGSANVINGNNATNQLFGGAGNDSINGAGGNDLIDGGLDNDTLNGGDGNDTHRSLAVPATTPSTSGTGLTTIAYTPPGFGNDVINSFDADNGGIPANQDRIDLSGTRDHGGKLCHSCDDRGMGWCG